MIGGSGQVTPTSEGKGRSMVEDGRDFRTLSAPLEYLLTSGGDSRLYIDPATMLNGYGCRPWPRPEAFTFASSTATSISSRAFAAAAAAHQRLLEAGGNVDLADACDRHTEQLRRQIKSILALDGTGTEIVFSSSGTDSQVHALYVAQTVSGGPFTSIIVAADETGSGTANAVTGRHFNSRTAQGATVATGERIAGFAQDMASVAIHMREADGGLRSPDAIDREVADSVASVVAAGRRVILHVMDSSKFAWRSPSLDCLRQIKAEWGTQVQVVIDACQLRLGRPRLKFYLEQGYLVLITGSKFFTGPPFSGALLVPRALAAKMAGIDDVPAGLRLYANRNDWPIAWHGIRAKLPVQSNVGQLLRWVAAAEELRAYFAVPESYRRTALEKFARIVPQLIAGNANLELLPACPTSSGDPIDDEMAARTIFPFFVRRRGRLLSVAACTQIYRALNRDVSMLLPASATRQQRRVAAQLCHIGQPVRVLDPAEGAVGTLRISAGARVVSETWCAAGEAASLHKLDHEFEQIRMILDKIALLIMHFDAVCNMDETPKMNALCEADFARLPSIAASASTAGFEHARS